MVLTKIGGMIRKIDWAREITFQLASFVRGNITGVEKIVQHMGRYATYARERTISVQAKYVKVEIIHRWKVLVNITWLVHCGLEE